MDEVFLSYIWVKMHQERMRSLNVPRKRRIRILLIVFACYLAIGAIAGIWVLVRYLLGY
jgi:hypothetical protein